MEPAGWRHALATAAAARVLGDYARRTRRGHVAAGEVGILLRRDPDTLRAPDVAFYARGRRARIRDPRGFPDVPPDLAVEVHDPGESDLARRVEQYLAAGVEVAWVLDPHTATLTRHAPGAAPQTWCGRDAQVEEPLLPGFSCRLADLLGDDGPRAHPVPHPARRPLGHAPGGAQPGAPGPDSRAG